MTRLLAKGRSNTKTLASESCAEQTARICFSNFTRLPDRHAELNLSSAALIGVSFPIAKEETNPAPASRLTPA